MKFIENNEVRSVTPDEQSAHEALQAAIQETQRERQLNVVRGMRNVELAACDWTQASDSPLTSAKKQEWADYRQALRDFMETVTDPFQVEFPAKPE